MLNRRTFVAGSAAVTLGSRLTPAFAADDRVIFATWGGGGATMFRDIYAGPFTKKTGIPVTISEVPDPSAVIAAAQGHPQHNVIIAASFQAATLARNGLIEELTEDDIPAIKKVPSNYWVKNADGKLIGMPVYFLYYGIAYNTAAAKPSDFASWKVLADAKWRDKISITRPVFLAPYDLTLYAKLNGGDERNIEPGIPLLEAVAKNAPASYTSMASLQQQLAVGDVVAAPFYSGQVQNLRKAGQKDIAITLPDDGGLALSYMLCIPKNAPGKAAALRYLNEVIDPDVQVGFSRSGFLPLTDTAVPADIEQDLGLTMAEVRKRTWSPDWYVVSEKIEERVRLVEQILTRAK